MQKKLLAAAVAGALALPGAALAASSVTITGYFQVSYAPYSKVSNGSGNPDRTTQDRVQDESSRIYFRMVEDLGGGLQAIGQLDWRVQIDAGSDATSGANWVGLRSKSWGQVTMGRHDLHYIYTEDQSYSRGGSLKMVNTSLLAYSAGGGLAVANATRTPNTIVWDSPNWKGFTVKVAYSTNPYGAAENALSSTVSNGYAWNIAPQYNAKNWGLGVSYYQGKADGTTFNNTSLTLTNAQIEGESWRVNGHYQWGGLRIGAVWDRSEWKEAGTNNLSVAGFGSTFSKRDAYSIPIRYSWGKWDVFGHYTWAEDDKGSLFKSSGVLPAAGACSGTGSCDTAAKMFAIGGSYEFSKRTSLALSYAKIDNDRNANYNLFTNTGSLGSNDAGVSFLSGHDPSQVAITMKHSF